MTYTPHMESLAPPPGTIAPLLAVQAMLGGAGAQIGWLLLGFGSIFFWGIAWNADLSGWRFREDTVARTSGVTLECRQTGFSQGRSSRRQWVDRNLYRYAVEGRQFQSESFAWERCVFGPVTVEYLRLDPAISRIAGMRRWPLNAWDAMPALLPAVGLGLVIAGLLKGRWRLRLLREGLPASGRLVEKVVTASSTRGRADYRMTFEFTAHNGLTGRASLRTNRPEQLEDGPATLVLYDPADLSRGLLFRSLPGNVVIDQQGQPARSGSRAFLFLPLVTVLGNAWYVYRHWIA